jgi:autotransporter-associated beta strand protein
LKKFLPLILAVVGVVTGDSVSFGAVALDADFSTYTIGTLNGQNSWAQVSSATAIVTPIQVIAAATPVPQSIKFKGIANAAQSYCDLPAAFVFNPVGATSQKTFFYVIENFRVLQAYNSSGTPGSGNSVCSLTTTAGGTGTQLMRLYVRRFAGSAANATTFDLGLNAGGLGVIYGASALNIGTAYKIVVSYTANPSGTLDVGNVYVNPVGQAPSTWTPEISQTIATDPAASMKTFLITPGGPGGTPATQNEVTVGRIIVGDGPSDVLPVPTAPISSAATSSSIGGFTANWAASAGATGYYLDVATDSAFQSILTGYNGKDVGAVTSYSVTGAFSAGATLYYRVRAYNSNGASLSSAQQQVTIIDVPVVLVPTVTNNSTSGTVTWTSGPGWTPNNPISDTNATVTFRGVLGGALNANNDSPGNFRLNSLVFTNTGSGNLNLTGNPLQFVSNGGTNPTLVFSTTATVLQSVGNNLQIDADLNLQQASQVASNSTVAGAISGSGGISKIGTGYAYITGVNNSFGGPVKVSAGVLGATTFGLLGQNSSLGTNGTIYLGDSNATSQLRGTQSTDQTSDKTVLVGGSGTFNYIENYGTTGTTLTLSGNIETSTNGAKSLRLNPKNGPIVISGTIGGNMPDNQLSLMLTNGLNQLTLTRSNAYNGGTYLQGGTLALSNSYALGTGVVSLYGVTITALTNINLTNTFQFAAAGVTAQITATTSVDLTNKISGNIAGFMGVEGSVRINTAFATAYLANPTNTFNSVLITQGAIAADSLGVAGSPSPLGTNGTITFGNGGTSILKYLGSGETNSKTLAFSAGASQWSILEHRGTGPLKLTSPLQIDRTTANTLILESQLTGSGELAASITNAAGMNVSVDGTRLAKSGPGDWTLSASNDYRNTSVQDGRLVAKHGNALPATRDVEMAGGTLLMSYPGAGATLGNLCLTNFKSSPNRYISRTVVPETYKFIDSTIDLGTDRTATLVFSTATNWIANQSANNAIAETYGPTQYLKVANSTTGGKLYITNTNGVPLNRIVSAEDTNLTAKITAEGLIYFNLPSNTAPTITSGGVFSVSENSTTVTTVVATDPESNALTYSISVGSDADKFWIDSSTGALTFLPAPDYESPTDLGANNVYNLTVVVSDGLLTAQKDIVVIVTNLSDSPADQKADWLTANGLLADSNLNTDPNNVGYSLATAYAFGLSPSVRGGAPISLASSTAGSVKIVYMQREGISGVTYVVKSGTDLAAGLNGTEIPQVSANQPVPAKLGYTQYEATYTPLAPATKGFLKVQAVVP